MSSTRHTRILQVCLSHSWGGLEMAAFELARDMHARGFDITTACSKDSRLGARLLESQLPMVDIDARKYFDPIAILRLRKVISSRGITNVVIQQLRDLWHIRPALIGFDSVRVTGFAHIFLSVHKQTLGHTVLYSRLDDLICLTEIQKENFTTHLPVPADKIRIVPNPVDMEVFHPSKRNDDVRRSLGAGEGETLIGVLGRLDQAKGQVETVEAARILMDAGLRFHVALVGEETLNLKGTKARLEERISALGVDKKVTLAGFRSDTPEIMASLDVLAMPSWAETFGRVLLEAMASKTAVVATRSGGVPAIIEDGVDGILVPPQDGRALAEAFRRLIEDPKLRERLQEAAFSKSARDYEIKLIRARLDTILTAQR